MIYFITKEICLIYLAFLNSDGNWKRIFCMSGQSQIFRFIVSTRGKIGNNINMCGSVKTGEIGKQLTSGCLPSLQIVARKIPQYRR